VCVCVCVCVTQVSRKAPQVYGPPAGFQGSVVNIIGVDCGMKHNIIRRLVSLGVRLKVVPWDYDFNQEDWDGTLSHACGTVWLPACI